MYFLLVSLLGCTTEQPQAPTKPPAGVQKRKAGKQASKNKARKAQFKPAQPFAPEGVAVSSFETTKGEKGRRICRWMLAVGKETGTAMADWPRPCPNQVGIAWSSDGASAMVRFGPDLFTVADGKKERLPGQDAYAGKVRDFGYSPDGQAWIATVDSEVAVTDGKITFEEQTLVVPEETTTPVLVHHYALNAEGEDPAWTHVKAIVGTDDASVADLGLTYHGTRTREMQDKLHGFTASDPTEDQAKALEEHKPEGEGSFKVATTDHGALAWWSVGDSVKMPILHASKEGSFDNVFEKYDTGKYPITLELQEDKLLVTTRGSRPRLYDLEKRKTTAQSNAARGVMFWPWPLDEKEDG